MPLLAGLVTPVTWKSEVRRDQKFKVRLNLYIQLKVSMVRFARPVSNI